MSLARAAARGVDASETILACSARIVGDEPSPFQVLPLPP
jgi:hypothetical protein